jgi:hypothetical protein
MSISWGCWTTQDELATVRKLYLANKQTALRQYIHNAEHRVWLGTGMAVDPGVVLAEARSMLDTLERAKVMAELKVLYGGRAR